jgi:hypothetical protein
MHLTYSVGGAESDRQAGGSGVSRDGGKTEPHMDPSQAVHDAYSRGKQLERGTSQRLQNELVERPVIVGLLSLPAIVLLASGEPPRIETTPAATLCH